MSKISRPSKRGYRSDLRASQAAATRKAIVAAAGRVCRAGGWPNATIASIAQEAGVSKETVYSIFKNKVTLIGEMVIENVAEGVPGRHFLEQERPRAISAETDQVRQIKLWAAYIAEILERVSPLMSVVRTGAEVEPEMAELYRAIHQKRRMHLGVVARSIASHGPLRNGMSVEAATDIIWQIASPEMFGLMSKVGRYSKKRYTDRLADLLAAALLR